MSDNGYLRESQRIQQLITRERYQRLVLGGVTFFINPRHFEALGERLYVHEPNGAGYGRYDWGVKPYEFTLQGTTGIYGVPALEAMNTFRPLFRKGDKVYRLHFGWRYRGIWYVNINRMRDWVDNDHPHTPFYEIDCTMLPPQVANYTKIRALPVPSNSIPVGLITTGGVTRSAR